MKVRVTGLTSPSSGFYPEDKEFLVKSCGTYAGVCYMPDDFDTLSGKEEAAEKRFWNTLKTNHHSISDHYYVNLVIEDAPKILAMALNNEGVYATSEKSGRYTIMKNCSEREQALYDKWLNKLPDIIQKEYPDMDSKMVHKLAMENARYFISVFAPCTTMVYSTNIRQLNYMYDWCHRYESDETYFTQKVKEVLMQFAEMIEPYVIEGLRSNKRETFSLFDRQNGNKFENVKEHFDYTYITTYYGSFTQLAQAHRHRTLKYTMRFNGTSEGFFTPDILRTSEDVYEWNKDMVSVADLIPQGTLVGIVEMGNYDDFLLKCTERLCGRAMYEIAKQTYETYRKYSHTLMLNYGAGSTLDIVEKFRAPRLTKGMLVGECKEQCYFGCKNGVDFDYRRV